MAVLTYLAVVVVVSLVTGSASAAFSVKQALLDAGTAVTGTSLGVLGGVAATGRPWIALFALPVVASLVLVLRWLVAGARDRARLEGLLAAAQSMYGTLGQAEVEAAACAAAADLLESPARVQVDAPGVDQLAVQLRPTGAWLVVESRSGLFPFTDADRQMLDAVGALATAALDNVALVDQVRHQSVHDPLTGLPNAVLFEDRLRQKLQAAARSGEEATVAVVDVDRFLLVNDAFGAPAGDLILREVGSRLTSALGSGATVSRRGSDEFTVLVGGRPPVEALVRAAFAAPFSAGGQEVRLTVSAGWAIFPRDGADTTGLIRAANLALWQAKKAEGDRVVEYRGDIEVSSAELLAMESDLHLAIERGELWVAYQPVLDIASDQIVGFEALVRWQHPVFGLVAPDRFLPAAERSDLISRIDLWVLDQSLHQLSLFEQASALPLKVAVNFSPRTLALVDLLERVREAAEAAGVPLDRLEVEVTEKVTAADATGAVEVLAALRALGVSISMDDFGTGYSALARLRDLPVDTIKIDQSFVGAIGLREDESAILVAATQMGHSLGLRVVAEGVETTQQLAFLSSTGCDCAQGYLVARPMSAAGARRWLAERPLVGTA